jgi:hypothetical protein
MNILFLEFNALLHIYYFFLFIKLLILLLEKTQILQKKKLHIRDINQYSFLYIIKKSYLKSHLIIP